MKSSLIAVILGLSIVAAPALASAEGLNPFSFNRQKKAPVSGRSADSSGGWKLPRLWPAKPQTASRKPAAPSTWQRMTSGTKSIVSQTADTLNPFNDANDKVQPTTITGSSSMFSQAANSKKPAEKSKSFLPSWLGGAEEEQKDRTVNDFLMRPRPDFN